MSAKGDIMRNLRLNIRRVKRLTKEPFGVCLDMTQTNVERQLKASVEEGVRIFVTYRASPAKYIAFLKDNGCKALHMVGTVSHAKSAEAEGVDIVIADGFEGGSYRSPEEVPNMVLIPQVADAVDIPVVASGGIVDARGYAAALVLGAEGVYVGTRFVATHECIAHPKFKEAMLNAVDSGSVIAGRYYLPTRILRTPGALKLREKSLLPRQRAAQSWESELGLLKARAALLDGDLRNGVAYCGAGVGLISKIMSVREVMRGLVEGAKELLGK
jgi:enoyl-[acyl-carrier protein] reductase II